ncbi:MAG: hypothetical protein AAGC55_04925 [Myxococcota bacterium]
MILLLNRDNTSSGVDRSGSTDRDGVTVDAIRSEGDFVRRTERLLMPLGFTGANSIACVGVCRDELCQTLSALVAAAWGEAFNFSSLAGMLFLGVTGFGAAHAHAPLDGGKERYIYYCMAHMGIGPAGEIGVCDRIGREEPSSACGALCAFVQELASGRVVHGIDRDDPEMSLLRERLGRYLSWGETPELLHTTRLAYQAITEDLERAIGKTVDTAKADYAVFTGIQLHIRGRANLIWPGTLYAVVDGERTALKL